MYGTIPIAASFYRQGMREDWLASFMMASILLNPQLIIYSAALGPVVLAVRIITCALCGMAAGLLILSRGGKFAKYSSLLIGDILAVTPADLLWLLLALLGTLVLWALISNSLLVTSVDPFLARSRGIRTRLVECLFVVAVAVAVMLSIRWVGVLLINALLILPAAAGRNLARSSRQHAAWSVFLALFSGLLGLTLSYYLDTSAGATIVIISSLCFAVSLIVRGVRK